MTCAPINNAPINSGSIRSVILDKSRDPEIPGDSIELAPKPKSYTDPKGKPGARIPVVSMDVCFMSTENIVEMAKESGIEINRKTTFCLDVFGTYWWLDTKDKMWIEVTKADTSLLMSLGEYIPLPSRFVMKDKPDAAAGDIIPPQK